MSSFYRAVLVGLVLLVLIADQATKAWVMDGLDLAARGSMDAIGPLNLTLVFNRGVSFGFLNGGSDLGRWGLSVFSVLVALILIVWGWRTPRPLLIAATGLLAGGALGNVIDRIRIGAVIDFVDASALHFPWVFNLADSAITLGVGLLLLDSFISPSSTQQSRADHKP